MPREKATVTRSRAELRARQLLQSEGCKTKLLCFSFFSFFFFLLVVPCCREADRHKICRSESPASWRISPSHMSPFHGPAPSRMEVGVCKPFYDFMSFPACVCSYAWMRMGRVSAGKAANMSWPPRGKVASEPGHTEAYGQKREETGGARSLKTAGLTLVTVRVCACVWGER